ncbi:MAG: VWA domain-containing protein [Ignavibacteriae bacterium]|nr:VWA domain-containing protein [Ignavibacteriota bacterium]
MFRFENSYFLYVQVLVPVFVLIYLLLRNYRIKLLTRYGDVNLLNLLMPDVSKYKNVLKFTLLLSALAFIILGTANPQIGTKLENFKREGVDVILAIDVSNSMKAEDVKPNRLERAKQYVSKLIDKMYNDRIGIIVFAGDAFIQLPLTTDYSAAKLFLSTVDCDLVYNQGTSIGKAIELSMKSFKQEEKKYKALIIITDGENHEDDAISMAGEAAKTGVVIYTIGMGSVNGAPIPIYSGNQRVNFMTDNEGNTVVTKLDAGLLEQIASEGNGKFIRSTGEDPDLASLLDEIAGMEKKEYKAQLFTDYVDYFQYLFVLALALLLADIFISERKNKLIESLNLFGERKQ